MKPLIKGGVAILFLLLVAGIWVSPAISQGPPEAVVVDGFASQIVRTPARAIPFPCLDDSDFFSMRGDTALVTIDLSILAVGDTIPSVRHNSGT